MHGNLTNEIGHLMRLHLHRRQMEDPSNPELFPDEYDPNIIAGGANGRGHRRIPWGPRPAWTKKYTPQALKRPAANYEDEEDFSEESLAELHLAFSSPRKQPR
jgi:hypothetical protein